MAIKYCPFRKESTTKTQVYETVTTDTFRPCIKEACMMYDETMEICKLTLQKGEIK